MIVYFQGLLLNKGIRSTKIELQGRSQRNRTQRTVRSNRNIKRFGHCRNLARLPDSSSMAQVRLNNIHNAALQYLFEGPTREHALPGRNRDGGMAGKLHQRIIVLRQYWLLNK